MALLQIADEGDCDCANIDVGVDPCFAPNSCECICQPYASLADDCGPTAELTCHHDCPNGHWPESDGTPSCACIVDLEMTLDNISLDVSMVTMTTESSVYIGGIDRLNFSFTWRFDDPTMDDEEISAECQVSFELWNWPLAVPPWNIMVATIDEAGSLSPFITCQYYESPTADAVLMLNRSGFISLRQTGDALEGHISIVVIDPDNPDDHEIKLSNPFETPVPES